MGGVVYSLALFRRVTNTPQSIVLTVPGCASSMAATMLWICGLMTGQLIADITNTAKGKPLNPLLAPDVLVAR